MEGKYIFIVKPTQTTSQLRQSPYPVVLLSKVPFGHGDTQVLPDKK